MRSWKSSDDPMYVHFCGVELSPLGAAEAAFQDAHERHPPPSSDEDDVSATLTSVSASGWLLDVLELIGLGSESVRCGAAVSSPIFMKVADGLVEGNGRLSTADGTVVEADRLALGRKAEKLGRPNPRETRLLLFASPFALPCPAILAADISLSFCSARSAPPPLALEPDVKVPLVPASASPTDCGFQVTRSARNSAKCEDSCCALSRSESESDALGLTKLECCIEERRVDLSCEDGTSAPSRISACAVGFQGVARTA